MKQDLALVSRKNEHTIHVRDFLRNHHIDAIIVENPVDFKVGLLSYGPAFLLLDFGTKGNKALFSELPVIAMRPLPYIMIADAFTNGSARAATLNRGADACVDSPINAEEVLAVVNAALRREHRITYSRFGRFLIPVKYKDMMIDPMRRAVEMRGEPVKLTSKEFDILYFLADHAGIVYTKEEIYEAVWKDKCSVSATNIAGHIFSLRQKLGLAPKDNGYIQTVFGVGYRFSSRDQ